MSDDPVVDELHRLRAEQMARFNFDFDAFFQALKEEERQSGLPLQAPPEPRLKTVVRRTRAGHR